MRFNNESAIKLSGVYNAKFLGFKAVPTKEGAPLIKVIFELLNPKMKLDYVLGSKIDMDKLNGLLKVLGKPEVKSINDIDVPAEGDIIPADWDKEYVVEPFYPVDRRTGVQSGYASIKAIVGIANNSVAQTANSIPSL